MSLYSFLPSPFRRYNSNEESFFAFVKRRPTRVGRVIKEKFGGEKKLVKFLWSQKLLSHSHSCLIHSTGKEFSLVFSFICILLLSSCIFCVFQYLLSFFDPSSLLVVYSVRFEFCWSIQWSVQFSFVRFSDSLFCPPLKSWSSFPSTSTSGP